MLKFVKGINVCGNGGANAGVPYICTDYNYQEDRNNGNYESVGFTLPGSVSNFIKTFGYGGVKYDWLFIGSQLTTSWQQTLTQDNMVITQNLPNNTYKGVIYSSSWYNNTGYVTGLFHFNTLYDSNTYRSRNSGCSF